MNNETKLTMKEFAKEVKSKVKNGLDNHYKIQIDYVRKYNDEVLCGLSVINKQSRIGKTIYLESLYQDYIDGDTIEDIVKDIIETYQDQDFELDIPIDELSAHETVHDRICMRLINREKNRELLKGRPYIPYLDLAIIFFIVVSKKKNDLVSIPVTYSILKMWDDINIDNLYEIASKNTKMYFKEKITSISQIIKNYDIIANNREYLKPKYIATNEFMINGATVITYDGFLESFSKKIGGDFYIIPSSIHEVLLIQDNVNIDTDHLKQAVRYVNSHEVEPEDVLSNEIYRYNTLNNSIEIVQ